MPAPLATGSPVCYKSRGSLCEISLWAWPLSLVVCQTAHPFLPQSALCSFPLYIYRNCSVWLLQQLYDGLNLRRNTTELKAREWRGEHLISKHLVTGGRRWSGWGCVGARGGRALPVRGGLCGHVRGFLFAQKQTKHFPSSRCGRRGVVPAGGKRRLTKCVTMQLKKKQPQIHRICFLSEFLFNLIFHTSWKRLLIIVFLLPLLPFFFNKI